MPLIFHRRELAERIAAQVMSDTAGSAAASGIFLAAPRRTGKSTFLREDLRPQLERLHALTLYVDLWEDRKADPGQSIVAAIRSGLAGKEGVIARLARSAGMDKVNVGGLSFDMDRVGLGTGVSATRALAALSDETAQRIVLIIDEAQHALTTEAGADAMFALKAARDELNSSSHHGMRIVATGSNRDKLALLRNNRDQAFFGAPLVEFPHLGRDYIEWFCSHVNLPGQLDIDAAYTLFVEAGFRPEVLGGAADAVRFDFAPVTADVQMHFAQQVAKQIEETQADFLRVIRSLTPLQAAVFRVLAAKGAEYAPFEAATFSLYGKAVASGAMQVDAKLDTPNVQQALSALQEKGLVWRAARGVYALEEQGHAEMLARAGLLEGLAAGPP
ncbi:MAG: ATP-binding protein [Burkholderiaceae bacterium]|nr:ATP-binding protein [Burkholderiaceae bacterium]MDH3460974.1 ATP-binding protein [Burkholderiaceae bacterium]